MPKSILVNKIRKICRSIMLIHFKFKLQRITSSNFPDTQQFVCAGSGCQLTNRRTKPSPALTDYIWLGWEVWDWISFEEIICKFKGMSVQLFLGHCKTTWCQPGLGKGLENRILIPGTWLFFVENRQTDSGQTKSTVEVGDPTGNPTEKWNCLNQNHTSPAIWDLILTFISFQRCLTSKP